MAKTRKKKSQLGGFETPKHLTTAQKAIFEEICPVVAFETPPQVVEAMATTLGIIREARSILDAESLTIENSRGDLAPHPALDIVAKASKTFDMLMANWSREDSPFD